MKNKEILDSWKAISQYLDRDIRTCHRWEKSLGLPIHRIDNESSRSKVFAYKSEIDKWLREKANSKEIERKSFLENKWIMIGLIFSLMLLLIIFAFIYFNYRITSLPSSEDITIAVLSFDNLNSSEYDEYFSEGIISELINNLTSINKLKVMAPPSASRYENINVKQLRKKLDVDYILKGNIEKISNKIKMIVKLIRTKDNTIIWDGKFEDALENVSSIPNIVCLKISELLNLNNDQNFSFAFSDEKNLNYLAFDNYLKGNYILKRLNEEKIDPWKIYHQGKYYWGKRTQECNELAINLFNNAIKIDNNFAHAYIGLAHCYVNYVNFKWDFNKKWLNKSENLIKKAQTIHPDLPEYYITLIKIYILKEIGFNENTRNFAFNLAEEGIKKHSNHPQLNSIVGYCYFLKYGEGGNEIDFDKALEYKEKSYWQNPYGLHNITYAELLMINKEYHKAIDACSMTYKHDSSLMANFRLGEIYYYLGDLEKSEAIFQQFEYPLEFKIGSLYYLGMIASQKGEIEKTQKILQEINILSPKENTTFSEELKLASIYMAMRKKELGYRHLNSFFNCEGIDKMRYIYYKYIDIDRNFDKYKNEAKFIEIIKK